VLVLGVGGDTVTDLAVGFLPLVPGPGAATLDLEVDVPLAGVEYSVSSVHEAGDCEDCECGFDDGRLWWSGDGTARLAKLDPVSLGE
jgi:hypothetical protein